MPSLDAATRPGLPAIVQPADDGYDAARQAWNLAADLRPAAIAVATTVEHVQAAVAYARERNLRVAPQGTGHLAVALPPLEDALLLKTQLEDPVEVDPLTRVARVAAGALWEDVVDAAAEHGLAAMHGSSPDVGVVGYLLGGGLSFYSRQHGLAANHVRAIELVTADGELRRVDGANDPDLFWALRGGGGGFGVVTAVEIDLLPIQQVFAGALFWPVSDAPAVIRAWVQWCRTAPTTITTSLRILCLPPLPEVPEPLRGIPHVTIDGVLIGDASTGAEVLAPLRAAAPPKMDMFTEMPAAATLRVHGDPEQPVPGISGNAMLGDLDDTAIDAFLEVTGEGSGSPLLLAELRQLGGALRDAPRGAGVTGALPAEFLLYAIGMPMPPERAPAIRATCDRLVAAMEPWATEPGYLNFAEQGGSAAPYFAPEAYARLVSARRLWDPERLFVSSHDIA